ncbi:MAG TPA: hypothetical protein VLL69_04275, partial [Streptosporangiaceae bacterium]|nr:hypothetical protein [Streptosporangiaceae bacterium]
RQLARRGTYDGTTPALVCPLVLAQAAEIEALPAGQFLTDPTKLANGLRALHGAFGTDVIVTAAADDLAAVAADGSAAAGHPRVTAAVEATRRLAATTDAVLAVALCGPAQLAAQLGRPPAGPAALEEHGAALLALAKAFLEAGAHLLLVVEAEPVPRAAADGWRSAVTPLVNVARFRQAAAAVVLADPADAALAPRGAVVCLPPAASGPGQGIALDADPAAWPASTLRPAGAPLVTTLGPVRGAFAECRTAVGQLTAALAGG